MKKCISLVLCLMMLILSGCEASTSARKAQQVEHQAKMSADGLIVSVNDEGKFGFIDENGDEVISLEYENAHLFSEGFAWVMKNNKWCAVNSNGKTVIPFEYDGESYDNQIWKEKEYTINNYATDINGEYIEQYCLLKATIEEKLQSASKYKYIIIDSAGVQESNWIEK